MFLCLSTMRMLPSLRGRRADHDMHRHHSAPPLEPKNPVVARVAHIVTTSSNLLCCDSATMHFFQIPNNERNRRNSKKRRLLVVVVLLAIATAGLDNNKTTNLLLLLLPRVDGFVVQRLFSCSSTLVGTRQPPLGHSILRYHHDCSAASFPNYTPKKRSSCNVTGRFRLLLRRQLTDDCAGDETVTLKGSIAESSSTSHAGASPRHSDTNPSQKSQKPVGVYARPSAAIERGSGFFVPGLEGPKVRWVGGGILLGVSLLNAASSFAGGSSTDPSPPAILIAQIVSVTLSLLVLLQGGVEAFRASSTTPPPSRRLGSSAVTSSAAPSAELPPSWPKFSALSSATASDAALEDRVAWVASTLLSLTRATHVLLIRDDKLAFAVRKSSDGQKTAGEWPQSMTTTASAAPGWAAAGATLRATAPESGRVALPPTHPTAAAVRDWGRSDGATESVLPTEVLRTVLLQRIPSSTSDEATSSPSTSSFHSCLIVASPDPLAAFPPRDLKAIGLLATYCQGN